MFDSMRIRSLTAVVVLSSWCAAAQAGNVTLNLARSTLQNVPDAAGSYQYEGGTLEDRLGNPIGTYLIVRRTGSSTAAYNTAATTITLFLPPPSTGAAPNVITIEGAWSFTSGDFLGSVSAASNALHWIVGADAQSTIPSGTTSVMGLQWVGSNELKL